jgi:hypothetical protein
MRTVRLCFVTLALILASIQSMRAWDYPRLTSNGSYTCYLGSWSHFPDFRSLKPIREASQEAFDPKTLGRDSGWAVQYKAILEIPVDGKYLVTLFAGDSARLFLDGRLATVTGGSGSSDGSMKEQLLPFKKGKHAVRAEYLLRPKKERTIDLKVEGPDLYQVDRYHWVYFGWPEDHPKSWSFMGGTVAPGRHRRVQFAVEQGGKLYTPDEFGTRRRTRIRWYLADEYMPSPVSEWRAGSVDVRIQHFANRVLNNKATVVFSRVGLTNQTARMLAVKFHVNASATDEVPIALQPSLASAQIMQYDLSLPPGKVVNIDFVALASGQATPVELAHCGSFDQNYREMTAYYKDRLDSLAQPVQLPDPRMTAMYKAALTTMWGSVVKVPNGDAEMRGSGGNPAGYYPYDRTFSHDVPNMVDQFIRTGERELPKAIMASTYYERLGRELEQDYLDAIPKYIIPFATYLQLTGDRAYFTPQVKDAIRAAARAIHEHRDFKAEGAYRGVMEKSHSLDNPPYYVLVDDFAALHGLAAYRYIASAFGDSAEVSWAENEMDDLNRCFNTALQSSMTRRNVDWYMCTFEDDSYFWKNGYDGNWIATSLMMSTFPWDAVLLGMPAKGTWADAFDRTVEHAMTLRDTSRYGIPKGSWGAWWHHEYGAAYNVGMGLQLLFSDRFRTEVVNNITFLLDNQSAPFQWGESFDGPRSDSDWTRPAADLETWALGFDQQAIQEICASVRSDGTVIIGRGIPDEWLREDTPIEWKNVRINGGRKMDFAITTSAEFVTLTLKGDEPIGAVVFDLPVFQKGVKGVEVDGKALARTNAGPGAVILSKGARIVRVELANKPSITKGR